MQLMFDSSNLTRRKKCWIIISPPKLYPHQNTPLCTATYLWELYTEIFSNLPFSWLLIRNNAQEARIHALHCKCLSKRKSNATKGSELSSCNTWKQKLLRFSRWLCCYSPKVSLSISQPFIMIYNSLTVSGCESCWWFQCARSHGWQLRRSWQRSPALSTSAEKRLQSNQISCHFPKH